VDDIAHPASAPQDALMKLSMLFTFVALASFGCGGDRPLVEAPTGGSDPAAASSATEATPLATADPPAVVPGPDAARSMPCRQRAREVEGAEDTSRLVSCPQGCAKEAGTVWGSEVYTDDSAVCPALVHAGVLPDSGGVASITFVRGLLAYVGSERNGVRSASYGKWRRSFYGQALGSDGKPVTTPPELPAEGTARIDCSHRGAVVDGATGASLTFLCPAGCAQQHYGLWGSGPYTSDSNLCAAATHAGILPAEGGRAIVTLTEGQPSYAASTKNGVVAHKYGKYGRSFTVSAAK
jgi:hypothetical protein